MHMSDDPVSTNEREIRWLRNDVRSLEVIVDQLTQRVALLEKE